MGVAVKQQPINSSKDSQMKEKEFMKIVGPWADQMPKGLVFILIAKDNATDMMGVLTNTYGPDVARDMLLSALEKIDGSANPTEH